MKHVMFILCFTISILLIVFCEPYFRRWMKYILYPSKVSIEDTIVKSVDTFIAKNRAETLTDVEHFQLGQLYHYGKFGTKQNDRLAIENYVQCINKSDDKSLIGKTYIQKAQLYEQHMHVDINKVLEHYLKALEYGYEESILHVGKIYLNGIHPSVLPDKMMAGRIFSSFMNVSSSLQPWCKLYLQDVHAVMYSDLDAIKQNGTVYTPLPTNIVHRIQIAIDKADKPMIAYQIPFDTKWLKQLNDDDSNDYNEKTILTKLPKQIIKNDTQNVHDSSLQNIGNEILNIIETEQPSNIENNDFLSNVNELLSNKEYNTLKYPEVKRVCNSYTNLIHSRFNKSEQEVFNMIWTKVKTKPNSIHVFLDNINSSVEHDVIVCSTGKIMRLLSTFDGIDSEIPDLKPDWIIKDEISQIIAKTITSLSSSEKQRYESDDEDIKETIKQRVKNKCSNYYKDVLDKSFINTNIDALLEFV